MKAFIRHQYGGPEVLQLSQYEKPTPADDEILVKIKALSVNPMEWHILRGEPYFARLTVGLLSPKHKIIGSDYSGIVETVGKNIVDFKPGDEVFGEPFHGSFAEYNAVKIGMIGHKPKNASFEEAACLGVAGLTALQGIRDQGKIRPGEKVLINGCSGGVGHFAVQIAKIFGAVVTGVCSSRNVEFVKSLGADEVIDYTKTNMHQHRGNFDVVIDVHGNLKYSDFKNLTNNSGRGVLIGFTTMSNMMGAMIGGIFGKVKLKSFTAASNATDLAQLSKYVEDGILKVNIDSTYTFEQIPDAITYIEKMHTRGKVAITVS